MFIFCLPFFIHSLYWLSFTSSRLRLPLFCLFLHSVSSPKTLLYVFHLPAGLPAFHHLSLLLLLLFPHIFLSLQHAASSLLLLYSSQEWVSDLNLSLCIIAPPSCSRTPSKTNNVVATLPRIPSFVCMSLSACNWTWNDKEASLGTTSAVDLAMPHLCLPVGACLLEAMGVSGWVSVYFLYSIFISMPSREP